ncbi:DUF6221 family protein [Streptomyces sp. EKS3.2]|uniref:DUF6221 family protein n=1 Tax=Streptomyces sp. EKS3.2 TaxID=3461008 RepID=UPI004041BD19
MDDLVQWLRAQLDEDEGPARAASAGPWSTRWRGQEYELVAPTRAYPIAEWTYAIATVEPEVSAHRAECDTADADHIVRHDPARVLREIDAARVLLAQYEGLKSGLPDDMSGVFALETAIRAKAAVYADRPGYREAWRP